MIFEKEFPAKIIIPKGWHRLNAWQLVRSGDRFLNTYKNPVWVDFRLLHGVKVGFNFVIRKNK